MQFGQWEPSDLGLPSYPKEAFRGGDPAINAKICYEVLQGQPGPYLDIVLANTGVSLYACGAADSPQSGVALARESITSGRARGVVEELIARSRQQEEQEA